MNLTIGISFISYTNADLLTENEGPTEVKSSGECVYAVGFGHSDTLCPASGCYP